MRPSQFAIEPVSMLRVQYWYVARFASGLSQVPQCAKLMRVNYVGPQRCQHGRPNAHRLAHASRRLAQADDFAAESRNFITQYSSPLHAHNRHSVASMLTGTDEVEHNSFQSTNVECDHRMHDVQRAVGVAELDLRRRIDG